MLGTNHFDHWNFIMCVLSQSVCGSVTHVQEDTKKRAVSVFRSKRRTLNNIPQKHCFVWRIKNSLVLNFFSVPTDNCLS